MSRRKTSPVVVLFVLPAVSAMVAAVIWTGSMMLNYVQPSLPALAWMTVYAFTLAVHFVTYALSEAIYEISGAEA